MKEYDDKVDAKTLKFIAHCAEHRGYPPSLREVQGHLDLSSPAAAMRVLNRLERDGKLTRLKGQSRTIQLVRPNMKSKTEPM